MKNIRLAALLTAAAMFAVTMPVFAADAPELAGDMPDVSVEFMADNAEDAVTEVGTLEALKTAVSEGGNVKLTAASDPATVTQTTEIAVLFEKAVTGDTDIAAYNIVLRPKQAGEIIYRFASADLKFALTTTTGALAYTIDPALGVSIIQNGDRFEFKSDNSSGVPDDAITIGTVTFAGTGTGSFEVVTDGVAENVVNTATQIDESKVAHYVTTDESGYKLLTGDAATNITNTNKPEGSAGKIEQLKLETPKKKLTINVTFPNEAKDNKAEYQQMYVTVSGGDLKESLKIDLATVSETGGTSAPVTGNFTNVGTYTVTYNEKKAAQGAAPAQAASYEVVIDNALTKNVAYNVEVIGEGYRTARYTVLMDGTEGEELTFWNNVKQKAKVIETGADVATKGFVSNFLAGDIVADNIIDLYDLSAVVSYFGDEDLNKASATGDAEEKRLYAKYDLNRDGIIDSKDIAYVLVSWDK